MKTNHKIKLGVSLYSYQDNYYFHKHDLEGCIAAAAGAGAEGIEVFPESMMPEWPYISDAFVDRWNGMMERYDLEPVCLDHFSDRRMWKNKNLSDDELFERSVWYIKTAARLGCKTVRMMHEEHIGVGFLKRDYKLTDISIIERSAHAVRTGSAYYCCSCVAQVNRGPGQRSCQERERITIVIKFHSTGRFDNFNELGR